MTVANAIMVRPLRFTSDLARMRAFYETLGFRPRIDSRRPAWLDMSGAPGMVALHEASISGTGGRPGETRLSFEVDDADALCRRLREAGNESATVSDEAYARMLGVRDPEGAPILVDERSDDDYGYLRHTAGTASPIAPVPVLRARDPIAYCDFFVLFGLEIRVADQRRAVVDGVGGPVTVEAATESASDFTSVDSAFETTERLADLAERLRTDGYADAATRGDTVVVTDPDGQLTRITASPGSGS